MRATVMVGVAVAVTVAACGARQPPVAVATPNGEVLVSAAASLTDAFEDIEVAFEVAFPDVDVILNLGGSSTLREQILAGAPADVFASADTRDLGLVAEAEMVAGNARTFARNGLAIAVPAGNPGGVTGLADFAAPELFVGLCAEQVPCGSLAREVLGRAGIRPTLDTDEPDVRALLTKVAAGELDLAMVYASDVVAGGDAVRGLPIPAEFDVSVAYPIAALADAPNAEAARAFVEFVLSDEGRSILLEHGFQAP